MVPGENGPIERIAVERGQQSNVGLQIHFHGSQRKNKTTRGAHTRISTTTTWGQEPSVPGQNGSIEREWPVHEADSAMSIFRVARLHTQLQ